MATTLNIKIDCGATFVRDFTYSREPAGVDPIDLTTLSDIRLQIRSSSNEAAVVTASKTGGEFTITGEPEDGQFKLTIPDEATVDVPGGTYRYDLLLLWQDGRVDRILQGTAELNGAITRAAESP